MGCGGTKGKMLSSLGLTLGTWGIRTWGCGGHKGQHGFGAKFLDTWDGNKHVKMHCDYTIFGNIRTRTLLILFWSLPCCLSLLRSLLCYLVCMLRFLTTQNCFVPNHLPQEQANKIRKHKRTFCRKLPQGLRDRMHPSTAIIVSPGRFIAIFFPSTHNLGAGTPQTHMWPPVLFYCITRPNFHHTMGECLAILSHKW